MRIAVFDHEIVTTNAIGRMGRLMLEGLSDDHHFTVFAIIFDNPNPDRIEFVRVPALPRPLFLRYLTFHLLAPLCFFWYRWRHRVQFDLNVITDGSVLLPGVLYAHFCNTAYLRDHWQSTRPHGLRRWTRWLDHKLRALAEPILFRQARRIVVPSQGLAREIGSLFGLGAAAKMQIIGNAVDIQKMIPPADFDRAQQRAAHGLDEHDLVLIFVALGHFERKGLPLLMEAMGALGDVHIKLLVVGGTPSMIEGYERKAREMGIADQLRFAGSQRDIRPFLWMSDLFAFPSAYETFSVASFEASAAHLPILVSHFYGVEDYVIHDENGWLVERNAKAITEALGDMSSRRAELKSMGQRGAEAVADYDPAHFLDRWRALFAGWRSESGFVNADPAVLEASSNAADRSGR